MARSNALPRRIEVGNDRLKQIESTVHAILQKVELFVYRQLLPLLSHHASFLCMD